jgi:uncharacterized protein YwgA
MKEYWLAKLIGSVGEVKSRKQLQKSVYLLQVAGCPLKCDYVLHYYGPYSFELAELTARLKGAGVIEEKPVDVGFGRQYSCNLDPTIGESLLRNFEKTGEGKKAYKDIEKFIERFKYLNSKKLWLLELAATVAFLFQGDWETAKKQTAAFKKIPFPEDNLSQATDLAKEFRVKVG